MLWSGTPHQMRSQWAILWNKREGSKGIRTAGIHVMISVRERERERVTISWAVQAQSKRCSRFSVRGRIRRSTPGALQSLQQSLWLSSAVEKSARKGPPALPVIPRNRRILLAPFLSATSRLWNDKHFNSAPTSNAIWQFHPALHCVF